MRDLPVFLILSRPANPRPVHGSGNLKNQFIAWSDIRSAALLTLITKIADTYYSYQAGLYKIVYQIDRRNA